MCFMVNVPDASSYHNEPDQGGSTDCDQSRSERTEEFVSVDQRIKKISPTFIAYVLSPLAYPRLCDETAKAKRAVRPAKTE